MRTEKQRKRYLRKSIKQHWRLIQTMRYRYFVGGNDFERFRKDVLFRLTDECKKMQEEYDALIGRS